MADHLTCTWTGASGREYVYDIHTRHPALPPNEPGNFIYAKLNEHKRWLPIYIGEGNLTERAAADPRGVECVNAKGATHVHVHVNYDHAKRAAEVRDLLENFPQAYAPDGCNRQQRG